MSNRLQWVKEKVISNTECNKSYNQQWVKQEIICASGWDSPWKDHAMVMVGDLYSSMRLEHEHK